MTTGIELQAAWDVAGKLLDLLASSCLRIEVAGSIRRGKAMVKDVELVAIPRQMAIQSDLFGQPGGTFRNLLDARCDELLGAGIFHQRLDKNGRPRWGSGVHLLTYEGVPVDLFGVLSPERWGAILAIRTGPGDFNQLVVTSRLDGGAMPPGMRQVGGALTRGGVPVPTPEEDDWFREIGLPCWPPAERSAETLKAHLTQHSVPR